MCNKLLIQVTNYTCVREDGLEYERPEYTCSFDGTRVPVDNPKLLAALQRKAESHASEANDLRAQVKKRNDLLAQLPGISSDNKGAAEGQIRMIEEKLAVSKQYLEHDRDSLLSFMNKNTEVLLNLEHESKSSLNDAEIKGLGLYEEKNKKELRRIESLLAIINSTEENR